MSHIIAFLVTPCYLYDILRYLVIQFGICLHNENLKIFKSLYRQEQFIKELFPVNIAPLSFMF